MFNSTVFIKIAYFRNRTIDLQFTCKQGKLKFVVPLITIMQFSFEDTNGLITLQMNFNPENVFLLTVTYKL